MLLNQALLYLTQGLSVIPLEPNGKKPLIPWSEYTKRLATHDELKLWFRTWPSANLGIITGKVSGVAIIDLDGAEGIQAASKLKLTSRVISLTGRGEHLWFKYKEGLINSVSQIAPHVDVRSDGGYVVAPGSLHSNGLRYRWKKPLVRETLENFPVDVISVTPAEKLSDNTERDWIAKDLKEMKNGNIDNTLFSICCRLRGDGYSAADARTLLLPHAKNAGATDGHLDEKIDNVWARYEARKTNLGNESNIQSNTAQQLTIHKPTDEQSQQLYNERCYNSESTGEFSTGYLQFDALTRGLRRGEVLTVAARTGVGKTNWAITAIRTFCESGKKVLLFSTEMSFDQIWQRYITTLRRSEEFKNHQFYICDEFTPDIKKLEQAISQVMPDLFIFDHINHVGTDYHQLSNFMMGIKELARRFNIPAIVTAQLSRSADWVEKGERVVPRLSMIKGSGAIEEISAQVLLLSEKRVINDIVEIEGYVDKNRHGGKGMIQFGLLKNPYRMAEI